MLAALFRHSRHLSTSATPPLSNSQIRNKLKNLHDPDQALKLLKSSSNPSSPPLPALRYAQEHTIRLLAKSRRFSQIQTLLDSHKSSPQISHEPFLSILIRSYAVAGMFDHALELYLSMTMLRTPPSSVSFNALLTACLKCKVFDRVPRYFRNFPAKFGFSPDKLSYGILIRAYCEMELPEAALVKLGEMERRGFEVNSKVFSTILHGLYQKGSTDEAERFWDEMVMGKGFRLDVACYNVRLFHTPPHDYVGIERLIEEMMKMWVMPDVRSYDYILRFYYKSGIVDEGEERYYYKMLKRKGCYPDAKAFRDLVYIMCKQERFVAAYKVFNESVRHYGSAHRLSTLRSLVNGLLRTGHKNEAQVLKIWLGL